MKRKLFSLFFLTLAFLAGGMTYLKLTAEPPALIEHTENFGDSSLEPEEEKERLKLVGVWRDRSETERNMTMTLNKDGTGSMLVELKGWQAAVAAPKLRFDLRWSLKGKRLSTRTVGGEPADKVNVIRNTWDTAGEDTILELTDERLLLLDKNGKTKHDWQRNHDRPSR